MTIALHRQKLLTSFFILLLMMIASQPGHSLDPTISDMEEWQTFQSKSGLFTQRMPKDVKTENKTMRINDDLLLHNETLQSVVDQYPIKNAKKYYITRFNQTLGSAFSPDEIQKMLDNDIKKFIEHYKDKNPLVVNQSKNKNKQLTYGDVMLVYKDDKMGAQGVKMRTYYSDISKLQSVYAGDDQTLDSRWTKDFFESVRIEAGVHRKSGDLIKEWQKVTAENKIFSQALPKADSPMVPEEAGFKTETLPDGSTMEHMRFYLQDPVRQQKIFYNVYGYKMADPLTYQSAEKLLTDLHITKHIDTIRNAKIQRIMDMQNPTIAVDFAIPNKAKIPYVDTVRLKAEFLHNFIMVQELYSSRDLVYSKAANALYGTALFHPDMTLNPPENADAPTIEVLSAPEASQDTPLAPAAPATE